MSGRYSQRFTLHMRLAKGGYLLAYDILDGRRAFARKTVAADTRASRAITVYQFGGRRFDNAGALIAAYEASLQPTDQREGDAA
jgi:hypothetical protein